MSAPIIAAYDPFTEDRAPVELARAAAAFTGAPLVVAGVYVWSMADGWTGFDTGVQDTITDAMQRVHDDLGVETRILNDVSVPQALHALARELDAGLIVAGSTDRGAAGRVLPGSTAERLLHGSPCPVALAPRGYASGPVHTVAVGFVDSPEGHAALGAAHVIAEGAGARLRVIAALHPSGGRDAARAEGVPPRRGVLLEGRHRAETELALARAVAALEPGVVVETELHVDDPADELLRVSLHADILVCGSRGYGPLRSVLLGGVSRRLVDGAHCPVLVLPREAWRPLEDLVADTGAGAVR